MRTSNTWEARVRDLRPHQLLFLARLADAHEAINQARTRLRSFEPSEYVSDRYRAATVRYNAAHSDLRVILSTKPE